MKFKVLDLFCGCGGMSYGFDSIPNFETVIGVDFDKNVLTTFDKNIHPKYTICGDLTDEKTKADIVKKSRECGVNMIIGGPPCQGFSLKGKNLGLDDPRNFLFLEYVNLVAEIKPEVFVIENVKNLLNACDGFFIEQIKQHFSELGYILNYGVLNAVNFGVPQHRERTIIVGSKTKSIPLPAPQQERTTVHDAISDLCYLNSGEGEFKSEYKYEPQSIYQNLMRKDSEYLYNHQATSHSEYALEKLAMIPAEGDKTSLPEELHGKQKFATTWSRLVWNSQSPTIDTRFDTPSNGRNSHPYLNRSITPREAARLQSFPDTFIFYGKKCSVCKQIGNAVPPLLAKAIANQIAISYDEEPIIGDGYELHLDDAYSVIKVFEQKNLKVDAIITDPPYKISKENNFDTLNNPRAGVDFGEWDKDFDLYGWIKEYCSLLKPNGCVIIFCSYLYISYIIDELTKCDVGTKDILIWKKTNPMPRNTERRYVQDTEFAVWGVKKNGKWTFNKPKNVSYLRSTFESSVVSGSERTSHPTQKSLKVMSDIINIHTKPGDIVIDPFMGSGTTGVACCELKRNFIGVEIDSQYFNIAKERIENCNKAS